MRKDMSSRVLHGRGSKPTSLLLVLGALLALFAMANMLTVTNWHSALVDHDDFGADAALFGHEDGHRHDSPSAKGMDGDPASPANDLHNITHSMIHGLADLVPDIELAIPLLAVAAAWFVGRDFALSGIAPQALLRPPRS